MSYSIHVSNTYFSNLQNELKLTTSIQFPISLGLAQILPVSIHSQSLGQPQVPANAHTRYNCLFPKGISIGDNCMIVLLTYVVSIYTSPEFNLNSDHHCSNQLADHPISRINKL